MTRRRWTTDEDIEDERRRDDRNFEALGETGRGSAMGCAEGCLGITPILLGLLCIPTYFMLN